MFFFKFWEIFQNNFSRECHRFSNDFRTKRSKFIRLNLLNITGLQAKFGGDGQCTLLLAVRFLKSGDFQRAHAKVVFDKSKIRKKEICDICALNLTLKNLSHEKLLNILLYGSENFSFNINKKIVKSTIKFLKTSERFISPLF